MSENYDDKDLEKLIFKGGLASGAIEPSEKFWNKAYEHILERGINASGKNTSRWRAAFFAMGAIALLVGSYSFYVHNEVSAIKLQLTRIESTQTTIVQQNANQTTIATSNEKPTIIKDIDATNTDKSLQKHTSKSEVSLTNTVSANAFKEKKMAKHMLVQAQASTYTYSVNPSQKNTVTNRVNPNSDPITENSTGNLNSASPIENNNITKPIVQTPVNIPAAIPINSSATSPAPALPVSANVPKPATHIICNTKTTDLDSSNALYLSGKTIKFKNILSKTSISAFYAPGKTDDFLSDKDNDPTHTITAHILKAHQDGDGTYALGVRLSYDLSDKWSIQAGCSYSLYSYNINPTIIYAQQQENGQIGYSITTSSGTVFLPYPSGTTHVGDSIKVKGSSSRGYISIPLQAKYKLVAGKKLDCYITGGFALNIANYKETQIHWENTALQEGDIAVQGIYGLNTVQYSYSFGMGAEYLVRRGLSLFAEPYLNGSFTSINKNTPVTTYPYFFGLAMGVTYHF